MKREIPKKLKNNKDKVPNYKKNLDFEKYKKKVKKVKRPWQKTWKKFDHKITENFRDNQKLLYGTLKQLRNKRRNTT